MRVCKIEGCDKPHDAKGFCSTHYKRWMRFGDPLHVSDRLKSPEERFEMYYEEVESGCWEWQRGKNKDGYGYLSVNDKATRAHRFSWGKYLGDIPKEMRVLHKCDNRKCVNPEHLFLGTDRDNIIDRNQKGRDNHFIGEGSPRVKFTTKQVLSIRIQLMIHKGTDVDLATKLGIPVTTLSGIKHNHNWKHVPSICQLKAMGDRGAARKFLAYWKKKWENINV